MPRVPARHRLLLRLVEAAHRAGVEERDSRMASERAAVSRAAGALTGTYPKDYLADLRADWPE